MEPTLSVHSIEALLKIYDQAYKQDILAQSGDPLYEPFYYFISQQGKRIRPLLLLTSADLFGSDLKQALPPAFAIELFHNFSLVHDDIMDEATVRRGRPAVHTKFGNNRAILAGDMMLIHVYKQLTRLPANFLPAVLQVFNQAAEQVIEGQELDMKFETEDEVSLEDYITMIKYKTSVLLAAALKIGGILGEAPKPDLERIYAFGIHMGLAFQIKDDWLDAFGEGEKFGKRIGGDIVQNKKTCLYIKAFELANPTEKAQLTALQQETEEEVKIQETLALFNKLGIQSWALQLSQSYYNEAERQLAEVEVEPDRKKVLASLAEQIFLRDH